MGFDFKAKILSLLKRPILDYVMPFVRWEPNFNTLKGAAPFSRQQIFQNFHSPFSNLSFIQNTRNFPYYKISRPGNQPALIRLEDLSLPHSNNKITTTQKSDTNLVLQRQVGQRVEDGVGQLMLEIKF